VVTWNQYRWQQKQCRILRKSYEDLTKFLQRSYEDLTKILQRSYEDLTKILQRSYKDLTKILQSRNRWPDAKHEAFSFAHGCVAHMVITSAYRTGDPGFESRQGVGFLGCYSLQCSCHNSRCIAIVCT
jgi:hypothetical protein